MAANAQQGMRAHMLLDHIWLESFPDICEEVFLKAGFYLINLFILQTVQFFPEVPVGLIKIYISGQFPVNFTPFRSSPGRMMHTVSHITYEKFLLKVSGP